jgi:transposase
MANEFWLNEQQWSAIEPLLPRNQPGARRVDDRRVISGIVHVLKVGCRWEDCPALYGPSTTIYNRFNRWSRRGLWQRLFEALVRSDGGDTQMIDSTTAGSFTLWLDGAQVCSASAIKTAPPIARPVNATHKPSSISATAKESTWPLFAISQIGRGCQK